MERSVFYGGGNRVTRKEKFSEHVRVKDQPPCKNEVFRGPLIPSFFFPFTLIAPGFPLVFFRGVLPLFVECALIPSSRNYA